MARARILVVDDEDSPRESLRYILKDRYEVVTKADGPSALEAVRNEGVFDAMTLDIKMPGMSGLEVLEQLRELAPQLPVVIATAITDARSAVQAMKLGAADYLSKPFDVEEIRLVIDRLIKGRLREPEVIRPRAETPGDNRFANIVGTGVAMQKIYDLVQRLVDSESTVLITGETGTGKELIARALHYSSLRKEAPFIAVHCAAIPSELLESELFGHEKGSFTGATQRRIGMFEAAHSGTLFLDEIGEMPHSTQSKLLRAIQEREIRRVGGQDSININVRIVCATNRNLELEVKRGTFREDLFYRVNVVPIHLPPLRERRDDIAQLIAHFSQRFAKELNRPVPQFTPAAMELLMNYPWPGNVRELEHTVERVLVMSDAAEIGVEQLPFIITGSEPVVVSEPSAAHATIPVTMHRPNLGEKVEFNAEGRLDLTKLTDEIERTAIVEALKRTNGVMTEAARLLNITRRMLRYKMDKLGIAPARGVGNEGTEEEAVEATTTGESAVGAK